MRRKIDSVRGREPGGGGGGGGRLRLLGVIAGVQ